MIYSTLNPQQILQFVIPPLTPSLLSNQCLFILGHPEFHRMGQLTSHSHPTLHTLDTEAFCIM